MEEKTLNGRRFYRRPLECDEEINPELTLEQLLTWRNEVANIIDALADNVDSIADQTILAKDKKELTG
jgi:hypothetical protein